MSARKASLLTDGQGRMLVFPVDGINHSAPVGLLAADVSDQALGEAILDTIARSDPLRPDAQGILAEHWAAIADAGVNEKDFGGYPSLGFRELRPGLIDRLRRRPTLIGLAGWEPDKGASWKPYEHEDISVAAADAATLGRAARALLARIPAKRPQPIPARTGVSFGYKTGWLAVRTADPKAVAAALGLVDVTEVGWEEGVALSYEQMVFVSPPIQDWVLAVGVELTRQQPDTATLSGALGTEVQFFANNRVVEAQQWERAEHGQLKRYLRYVGESGEAEAGGESSEIERALGFDWVTDGGSLPEDAAVPDEEDVFRIAAEWSLDPHELDVIATSAERGLCGRLAL
jgi:hypothetical protein